MVLSMSMTINCIRCKRNEPKPNGKYCQECIDKVAEYRRKRQEKAKQIAATTCPLCGLTGWPLRWWPAKPEVNICYRCYLKWIQGETAAAYVEVEEQRTKYLLEHPEERD